MGGCPYFHFNPERTKQMYPNYNMNQLTLDISTSFEPKENHVALFINELVASLQINQPYLFGRPREYDLGAMMKLVLFAYTRETFTSRKIERLAEENLYARWLTQEQVPSYRTIARFCISNDIQELTNQGLDSLTEYLRERNLIDDALFIDGTKILADANKFSFVWKKSTIRYDQMNREKILTMMSELKEAYELKHIPEGSTLTLDMIDELLTRMELRLESLEKEVEETKKISPNPAKHQRRTLKSQKRKLFEKRNKLLEHQNQMSIYGTRNSYSKTDHDATFMRVKEDHMRNGQLKPAYNLQIATCNQFVLGYDVFQNPTDTRTLQPLLEKMRLADQPHRHIVADAGYGSENNYRYLEDELPQHTGLIPYATMLKEQSKKWKTDERKVMNWAYHEEEDFYIDPKGVQFKFHAYRQKKDKDGFVRDVKEYQAEKLDVNQNVIPAALTPKGHLRKITVNSAWEYHKAKQRELLSTPETGKVYSRRKIDVETVFGFMKACLGFTRYTVRGLEKVRKQSGILITAINMMKLAKLST